MSPSGTGGGLEVQSTYQVAELARMAGMKPRTMRRWLYREEVVVRQGRSVVVPLVRFRDAFPEVWESIRIRMALKPGKCGACGSVVVP